MQREMNQNTKIDQDFIGLIGRHGGPAAWLTRLEASPHTWGELFSNERLWCMVEIPGIAIDLTGLTYVDRALLMAHRQDCPIDLTNIVSFLRAEVMAFRRDCPIDFTGMNPQERARVMATRLDCPIDLTGMDSRSRARVMAHRLECPLDLEGLGVWERAYVKRNRPWCGLEQTPEERACSMPEEDTRHLTLK